MNIEQTTHMTTDGTKVAVFKLNGRLDATSASTVRLKLEEAISTVSRNVLVNLSEVSFMDSTGLTCLMAAQRAIDKVRGSFRISNLNDQTRMAFEVTSMDRVIDIFKSAEEALEDPWVSS